MTNVKPHFECSGYGCSDCTKGVVIEEPEITNLKLDPDPRFHNLFILRGNLKFLKANIKEHNEMNILIKGCFEIPIATIDGKRGYFVEIEE